MNQSDGPAITNTCPSLSLFLSLFLGSISPSFRIATTLRERSITWRHLSSISNTITRMSKDSLLTLHSSTSISNIRGEDLRQLIELGRIGAALDFNLSTVHIHLTVSLDVKPAPREQRLAARRKRGDLEVPFKLERAAAHVRLDHAEGLAVIITERDLA